MHTVEERLASLEAQARMSSERQARIEAKLDQLLEAAHMGRGAWWIILQIGGVLVGMSVIVGAVLTYFRGHP